MKKTLLLLLLVILTLAVASAETIPLDATFTQDTTILLDLQNITSLTVTGSHVGNTSNLTLVTNKSTYRVASIYGTIDFEEVCAQTCSLEAEHATALKAEVSGKLQLSHINYTTSSQEPAQQLKEETNETQKTAEEKTLDKSTINIQSSSENTPQYLYTSAFDDTLKKIDSQGNEVWSFTDFNPNTRAVATDYFGNVYLATSSSDDSLTKIDSQGNKVWGSESEFSGLRDVVVDRAGNIIVLGGNRNVYKLNQEREILWQKSFDFWSGLEAVAVDGDNNVYIAPYDTVLKYDPDGELIWNYSSLPDWWHTRALTTDRHNNVYVATQEQEVHKLNSEGEHQWTYDGHTSGLRDVQVDHQGNVYVSEVDPVITKLNSNGELVWTVDNGHGGISWTALVDASGNIYTVGSDNTTRKHSPEGEQIWTFEGHEDNVRSGALDKADYIPSPYFVIHTNEAQVTNPNTNLYYDLSLAPNEFWQQVGSTGADIRVYTTTGLPLAREVIGVNTTSQTGSLFFRSKGLRTDKTTSYVIHYGNSSLEEPSPTSMYGRENVWDDSYAAVYHLLESEGLSAYDSTKESNDATFGGNLPTSTQGKISSDAQYFDGSDSDIELPNIHSYIEEGFSVSMWINKIDQDRSNRWIFGAFSSWSPSSGSFLIWKDEDDRNILQFRIQGVSSTSSSCTVHGTAYDEWMHTYFTYDRSTAHTYVDGEERCTSSFSELVSDTSGNWYIGFPNRQIQGSVQEVRVSNQARSSSWIQTEYNNQNDPASFWNTSTTIQGIYRVGGPGGWAWREAHPKSTIPVGEPGSWEWINVLTTGSTPRGDQTSWEWN